MNDELKPLLRPCRVMDANGAPHFFAEATAMEERDGHLYIKAGALVLAAFAPGKWTEAVPWRPSWAPGFVPREGEGFPWSEFGR